MKKYRTDMAIEECENIKSPPSGVKSEIMDVGKARIVRIEVENTKGAENIGKPIGRYVSVETGEFSNASDYEDGRLRAVSTELKKMISDKGTVLVAGLGNKDITPDAFGSKVASKILATRHLDGKETMDMGLGVLRAVASVSVGVLGQTGIESAEIIRGISERIKPSVVIAVDALASKSLERLGKTVQISDVGIIPGSGVGNSRKELSIKTLGVPVIAVGVPTVVDGATLVHDLVDDSDGNIDERISPSGKNMMVTPRDVDTLVENAANLVALSINCALHPHINMHEMLEMTL